MLLHSTSPLLSRANEGVQRMGLHVGGGELQTPFDSTMIVPISLRCNL